jgi:hypothetical protein
MCGGRGGVPATAGAWLSRLIKILQSLVASRVEIEGENFLEGESGKDSNVCERLFSGASGRQLGRDGDEANSRVVLVPVWL